MNTIGNIISMIVGVLGGVLSYFLGGFDQISKVLIYLTVIDYVSGVIAAFYNKDISSKIGFKGILKKITMFLVVGVAVLLERYLAIPTLREIVIMFFVGNEGISILENVAETGLKIPEKLKNAILQINEKETEEKTENESND